MARLPAASVPLSFFCLVSSSLAAIVFFSTVAHVSGSAANDAACAALSSSAFGGATLPPVYAAAVPPNVCASIWAEDLHTARGMVALPHDGGLIVVSRNGDVADLVWLNDTDGNGSIDSSNDAERKILTTIPGLTHGVALWQPASADPDAAMLLASSDTTVYRWPFRLSAPNSTLSDAPAALVINMPRGGHNTRTITIDPISQRWLYVSVGSVGNIDTSPTRSGLWRFDLAATPVAGAGQPFDFARDGSLFAGGLRNEVALAWDRLGVLWGAENGADELDRADLGGDVHNDNPGEEINKFDRGAGAFYGYPYCFSECVLGPGVTRGAGVQWAWPSFLGDGVHDDAWCRAGSNVVSPHVVMPAHTAPLGMRFYPREMAESRSGAAPPPFAFPPPPASGDAVGSDTGRLEYLIVAQHGSWNRSPPSGYRVVRFPTAVASEDLGVQIVGPQETLLWFDSDDGSATGDGWGRPVDVTLGRRGEVLITDDSMGRILVLRHLNFTGAEPRLSSTGGNGAGAVAPPLTALVCGLLMGLLAAVL